MNRARLLVLNAPLGVLDYRVPQGMTVEPGSVVVAPLGPRQIVGVVWEPERLPGAEVPEEKLRPLLAADTHFHLRHETFNLDGEADVLVRIGRGCLQVLYG